jgi:hypothetical protein
LCLRSQVHFYQNGRARHACQYATAAWVGQLLGENSYYTAYYCFRILFVHVFPCTALVILNLALFRTLHRARRNRQKLFQPTVLTCSSGSTSGRSATGKSNQQPCSTDSRTIDGRTSGRSWIAICLSNRLSNCERLAARLKSGAWLGRGRRSTQDPLTDCADTALDGEQSDSNAAHSDRAAVNVELSSKSEASSQQQPSVPTQPLLRCTVDCRRQRDSNCTTLMLIVVVSVFLATEIPLAITTLLHVAQNALDIHIADYQTLNSTILFTNFFIMFSYPVNFAIYCGMSRQFRQTFKQLFFRRTAELMTTATSASMAVTANATSTHTDFTRTGRAAAGRTSSAGLVGALGLASVSVDKKRVTPLTPASVEVDEQGETIDSIELRPRSSSSSAVVVVVVDRKQVSFAKAGAIACDETDDSAPIDEQQDSRTTSVSMTSMSIKQGHRGVSGSASRPATSRDDNNNKPSLTWERTLGQSSTLLHSSHAPSAAPSSATVVDRSATNSSVIETDL